MESSKLARTLTEHDYHVRCLASGNASLFSASKFVEALLFLVTCYYFGEGGVVAVVVAAAAAEDDDDENEDSLCC